MYAPHTRSEMDRQTFSLGLTLVFASLPLAFMLLLAFPVATLGFTAGVLTALAVNR